MKLRIIAVERLGETFNQTVTPLSYTPRQMVMHPANKLAIIIETDYRAYTPETLQKAVPPNLQLIVRSLRAQHEGGDDGCILYV